MQYESKFRKEQAEAKRAYKNRGRVIHSSCQIIKKAVIGLDGKIKLDKKGEPVTALFKESIQGTYTCLTNQQRVRCKAAIKTAKKLTHTHHYYRMLRGIKKLSSICAVELKDKNLYIDIEANGLKSIN